LLQAQNTQLSNFEGFSLSDTDTRRSPNDPLAGLSREEVYQRQLITDAANSPDPSELPFNDSQRRAFTTIYEACNNDERRNTIYFVDGPGGTGKTYVFNALLDAVRRNGDIAIAVASSGTAALLLRGGRTAHSTFKIPIKIEQHSQCNFNHGSAVARLIQSAS